MGDDRDQRGQRHFAVLRAFIGSDSTRLRYLFLRPHVDESTEHPSLFVTGIPAGVTDEEFVRFAMKFGHVHTAALHPSRLSAIIVFASDKGMHSMMKAAKKGKPVIIERQVKKEAYGLKSWVKQHKAMKPGNAVLQRRLDVWMEDYEDKEKKEKEAALKAMEEDGWTVVQRHKGRKKNTNESSGVTVGAVAAAAAEEMAKTKVQKSHENFYKFQQREKRKSDIMELREKFQQDKERLAELRASRKFKPLGGY